MPFPRVCCAALSLSLLLCAIQVPAIGAENVYLYRLKKLRNNFYSQVEEQVASSESIIEQSYVDTLQQLVENISRMQNEVRNDIIEPAKGCVGLAILADSRQEGCVFDAEQALEDVSEYIVKDGEKYLSKATDFNLWFMGSYLTDWEQIFGEEHYNDVYGQLSDEVLHWDNVGSIELFSFRQEVLRRFNQISSTLTQCMAEAKNAIVAEIEIQNCR